MSHVFVDGGGNRCSSVERYLKLANFDKVYVFEPNPIFYDSYETSDFSLVKKAIWTKNCKMPFYVSRDQNQVASSLLSEKLCKVDSKKVPYWYDSPIEVECVDFNQWLRDNIGCSQLTLKLDVEGAEYEVLRHMIDGGTISMVHKLYVEFHSDTLPHKKEEEDQLIEELKGLGVDPLEWD